MVEKKSVGIRESYALYKKEVENPKPLSTYLEIAQGFTKFLRDKLIDGQEICLPEGLGRMRFVGHKIKPSFDEEGNIKGLSPNWRATNELWRNNPEARERKEVIFFFNEHTNGIRYRLHWVKKYVYMHNKDFYSFKLARHNKDLFTEAILKGKEYIVEAEKLKPIYHGIKTSGSKKG